MHNPIAEPTLLPTYVASKVEEHRGVFRLTHPMEHGVVRNWTDMEKVSLVPQNSKGRNLPAMCGEKKNLACRKRRHDEKLLSHIAAVYHN